MRKSAINGWFSSKPCLIAGRFHNLWGCVADVTWIIFWKIIIYIYIFIWIGNLFQVWCVNHHLTWEYTWQMMVDNSMGISGDNNRGCCFLCVLNQNNTPKLEFGFIVFFGVLYAWISWEFRGGFKLHACFLLTIGSWHVNPRYSTPEMGDHDLSNFWG